MSLLTAVVLLCVLGFAWAVDRETKKVLREVHARNAEWARSCLDLALELERAKAPRHLPLRLRAIASSFGVTEHLQ